MAETTDVMKGSAPADGNYWTYWVHKVQELWKRVEALEEKVDALEVLSEDTDGEDSESAPAPKGVPEVRTVPVEGLALSEKELTVCMALKELAKPATLEEVNGHLKNTRMISEGLRDTLVLRLKGAVEKGYIGYDESGKTFILAKKTFLVE
ncbi:MAG: hypothetical protein V1820_03500 [archaeon]